MTAGPLNLDSTSGAHSVLRLGDSDVSTLSALLGRYGLTLRQVAMDQPIPGSFWGGEEAGLHGDTLLARADTPLHSVLHEACHYVCMDEARRAGLDTDAGGDYDEENAVCYLQILLADDVPGCDRHRMMMDMDAWGYSFRLGSARAWFEGDADDARRWLQQAGVLTARGTPNYRKRTA